LQVGASLGVAIAVHNIPEGLCVAMPVLYATGNPWKAFGWALLSGLTEPIGGIVGFAVLQPFFTPLVFGIVFSMVRSHPSTLLDRILVLYYNYKYVFVEYGADRDN